MPQLHPALFKMIFLINIFQEAVDVFQKDGNEKTEMIHCYSAIIPRVSIAAPVIIKMKLTDKPQFFMTIIIRLLTS